jgi:hypothetical protein
LHEQKKRRTFAPAFSTKADMEAKMMQIDVLLWHNNIVLKKQ